MDAGVHPSLHSKCHHQVLYAKLNLQIEYPPRYNHEVWDFSKAQFDLINKAIENFDWNKLFSGQDIHNQVNLFNTAILNIFRNFIPNKFILCEDKNTIPPALLHFPGPWVNEELRLLTKQKKMMFRTQKTNNDFDIGILNKLSEDLTNAITNSKLRTFWKKQTYLMSSLLNSVILLKMTPLSRMI